MLRDLERLGKGVGAAFVDRAGEGAADLGFVEAGARTISGLLTPLLANVSMRCSAGEAGEPYVAGGCSPTEPTLRRPLHPPIG